ncbi:MAG: fimbrial protein [Pseudomonadota bacterium]
MSEITTGPGGRMDDDEEPPLDPAAEKLRRKLTRLLVGSFGIMGLGFVAVFIAILYRTGVFGDAEAVPPLAASGASASASIAIEAGESVVSSDLDGNRILLRVRNASGAESLILFDASVGQVVGRYRLQPQPPQGN